MNRLLKLMIIIIAVSGVMAAQWTYEEDFFEGTLIHGVVVDPDGKIWITQYAQTDTLVLTSTDTVTASGISVFNSDGTEASFSPITTLTVDGVTDTLIYSNRGISLDGDGNILTSTGSLYQINYQTGEGMNKYMFEGSGAQPLTEAGADDNGFVYIAHVLNGHALVILDEDWSEYNVVADTVHTIQRSILASPDGKDVYVGAIYTTYNGILHYHSDDGPDGTYSLVDTLYGKTGKQLWAQILDWDNNGLLWVGTYWNVDADDFTGWYALDPTQDYFAVDTIGHNANTADPPAIGDTPPAGGSYYAPRGIAFSADGLTAYTADFDGGVVKKWTNSDPAQPGDTPILPDLRIDYERGNPIIAVEFTLSQNYPNPFNPTTTIPYDLKQSGMAKLTVYDMLGREIATLVNEPRPAGRYKVLFDATGLASGMYVYKLEFNNRVISKRMTYMK
ncbi:MAG: T9SS type A sorting domain-containing protein [Candidatus Neomarinimicrobiota bacterium]